MSINRLIATIDEPVDGYRVGQRQYKSAHIEDNSRCVAKPEAHELHSECESHQRRGSPEPQALNLSAASLCEHYPPARQSASPANATGSFHTLH